MTMKLIVCLIVLLIALDVLPSESHRTTLPSSSSSICQLKPTLDRVFLIKRKKRFLLLPNYGAIKITIALAKSLISKYPKGFNLSIEVSTYYPGPTMREDWIPKKFRKKSPQKSKPTTMPQSANYVYIPGTSVKYLTNKVETVKSTNSGNHQLISAANSIPWNDNSKWKYHQISKDFNWRKFAERKDEWSKGNGNSNRTHYHHHYHRRQPNHPRHAAKGNWLKHFGGTPKSFSHIPKIDRLPEIDDIFTKKQIQFPDLKPFEHWEHYRAHRDRREIFHHIEGFSSILGVDVKMCILRSICESKRFLLPPGYSMMQDLIRVLLSFPTLDGMDDDYSRAMRSDFHTCDRSFRRLCPISFLDWFMNPIKNV